MYTRNNYTLSEEDISDVQRAVRPGDVSLIDIESEEKNQYIPDSIDMDFAGALRLLLFSDKIIQPFEKKFIIDALALGLEAYDEDAQTALAYSLTKTGKISADLADRLLLIAHLSVKKILLEDYAYHSPIVLCKLAKDAEPDTLLFIAERRGLTTDVVHALVNRGIDDVTRAVLENKHAERGRTVIERVLSKPITDEDVCISLLNLPDMEPALALQLFWQAPPSVRLVILKRFLKSHALVEAHFSRMRTPNLRALPLFSASGEKTLDADAVSQGLQAAIDYFKQGQSENAFRLISFCIPLPTFLLQKIMQDRSGEAVVVLLKALGFRREISQEYLEKLSGTAIAKDWSETEYLSEVYDVISWGEAKMALSYWLWQAECLGPYQLFEEEFFLEKMSSSEFSAGDLPEAVSAE